MYWVNIYETLIIVKNTRDKSCSKTKNVYINHLQFYLKYRQFSFK